MKSNTNSLHVIACKVSWYQCKRELKIFVLISSVSSLSITSRLRLVMYISCFSLVFFDEINSRLLVSWTFSKSFIISCRYASFSKVSFYCNYSIALLFYSLLVFLTFFIAVYISKFSWQHSSINKLLKPLKIIITL